MVVKLVDLNLPCDPVREAMLDLDGQVTAIVEATELAGRNHSPFICAGFWCKSFRLLLGLVQRADFAATSLAFFSVVYRRAIETLVRDTLN